jgi:hypothetical protein
MARRLKTFTTSGGFFDLAVAAPSMKAALEAWGAGNNLFQHGFAKVTEDPAIVAATMAKPGVVLRRAVGSTGAFGEHADLPTALPARRTVRTAAKQRPVKPPRKDKPSPKAVNEKATPKAARTAALAFEKEQKRRDSERRREEAAQEKERERRAKAIAAAESALEEARQGHDGRIAVLQKERAALDRKSEAEQARWRKQREDLETALRKARSVSYLRPV